MDPTDGRIDGVEQHNYRALTERRVAMNARTRALLGGMSAAVVGAVVVVAIAGAQDSDSPGPAPDAEPGSISPPELIPFQEQETFRPGVPDDPHIDFCPTPEQVDAFAERTGGLDLKPDPPDGHACSSRGAWTPPDPPYPDPPEEQMSDEELCELEKEELLKARPLPSDDPLQLRGEKPDGGEIIVDIEGDPEYLEREGIRDIQDLAKGPC